MFWRNRHDELLRVLRGQSDVLRHIASHSSPPVSARGPDTVPVTDPEANVQLVQLVTPDGNHKYSAVGGSSGGPGVLTAYPTRHSGAQALNPAPDKGRVTNINNDGYYEFWSASTYEGSSLIPVGFEVVYPCWVRLGIAYREIPDAGDTKLSYGNFALWRSAGDDPAPELNMLGTFALHPIPNSPISGESLDVLVKDVGGQETYVGFEIAQLNENHRCYALAVQI